MRTVHCVFKIHFAYQVRGVELRKEETVGEEENMLDWIEDKEERDEKEKKEEEGEEKENEEEEKENEEKDGKEEQNMELTKENFSKSMRTRF